MIGLCKVCGGLYATELESFAGAPCKCIGLPSRDVSSEQPVTTAHCFECDRLRAELAQWHELSPDGIEQLSQVPKLKAELEKSEDRIDDEWLDSIAKHWNELTGKSWDTLDGETREEGLDANIGKLFQFIEEQKAELEKAQAECAAMRDMIRKGLADDEADQDTTGYAAYELITSCDCGAPLLAELERLLEENKRLKL